MSVSATKLTKFALIHAKNEIQAPYYYDCGENKVLIGKISDINTYQSFVDIGFMGYESKHLMNIWFLYLFID